MTTATPQEYTFQAEIAQLLHLLSHSLYQNREIAVRELVSNASDALDKFRHIALTDKQYDDGSDLGIFVEPNPDEKLLVIRDNGIGMTHDELIRNLGTIAHSGSLEFLSRIGEDKKKDLSLIGQFGVGFYSSFMLADRVEVVTRSYQEASGWRWESDGTGRFTIEPVEGIERGTQIRLHLKEGLEEFSREFRLKYILNEYSTFVPWPIRLGTELVNDQKPIWVEPKSQVTDEQYQKFYNYLTKRAEEAPLWHLHLTADSPFQFHAILYCPPANLELMGYGRDDHGLHLCAKRVLVQNNCRELLPEYLRFMHGLVDSADLPLNVSREALQDNTVFRRIRKVLVKKVLGHLEDLAQNDATLYRTFYLQFGVTIREGIAMDWENKDAIAKLLRFKSSHGDDRLELVSLADYVGRMSEDQKQIYYVGGPTVESLERLPNLEVFRARGIEVLYITDPVDEFVLNHLRTFENKELVPIDSALVELPETKKVDEASGDDKPADAETKPEAPVGFSRVLELFKETLQDKVEDVRESNRLTTSPCCLVSPEGVLSPQLQKVLSQNSDNFELRKRILEINPQHPFLKRLSELSSNPQQEDFIRLCGQQLLTNTMLLEGVLLDAHEASDRMLDMMQQLAGQKA